MVRVEKLVPCRVKLAKVIKNSVCDVLCIIGNQIPGELVDQFNDFRSFDKAFNSMVSCFRSENLCLPVVYSPVVELSDYHDVRVYQQAAAKSLNRVVRAGFQSPLLVVPQSKKFSNAELCTVLGALQELYVPIQLREDIPEKKQLITKLSLLISNPKAKEIYKEALLLESGRFVARDIATGDPERMCPPRVEEYVKSIFPSMKMDIISDVDVLTKEYPLFAAVNRAANTVKRHQGRIIFLEYEPPSKAKKTLMLVGKGVCYDTGGSDIKAGGIMASMSRDKSGAAAVAGFMQIVQERKPADIHVIAALCLVRNSVGEEGYVADEVITSRAGVRVRVGNTDAEGRMCMADALCHMKEIANNCDLPDPHIFTIATLTEHACLTAGEGYSIIVDNSVAHQAGHAMKLQEIGTACGEPFEISRLRQEDFDFNTGKAIGEDVVQCNTGNTGVTPRGHQFPVAFLMMSTGLDKQGLKSDKPLKYTHLDIASTVFTYPQMPTGTPVVALAKTHL